MYCFTGGCVQDYFLAGGSDFLETQRCCFPTTAPTQETVNLHFYIYMDSVNLD